MLLFDCFEELSCLVFYCWLIGWLVVYCCALVSCLAGCVGLVWYFELRLGGLRVCVCAWLDCCVYLF